MQMDRRRFLKASSFLFGYGLFNSITSLSAGDSVYDLLIEDAFVVDGSGKDGFLADIGIKGQRIASIGQLQGSKAYRVINVEGRIVAPGFIDIHSHSDDELLVNGFAESKVMQGVTTEVVGQDGASLAPLSPGMQAQKNELFKGAYNEKVDWNDFPGYFKRLQQKGISLNLATMLGQGTVREFVMGRANEYATKQQIHRMQEIVQMSLQHGVWGISSGLEYTPGAFASSEELIQLCKMIRPTFGLYATHMRSESDYLLEGLDEAIAVGYGAGVSLHISHLKCLGARNWKKMGDVFDKLREARRRGVSISMDRYPYLAYNTTLGSIFPVWARSGSNADFIKRLKKTNALEKIKQETLDKVKMIGSWDALMITHVELSKNKHAEGKRVSELVKGNGVDEFEYVRRLIIEENNGVDMCGFAMSAPNTSKILSHANCMIASDASARTAHGVLSKGKPHPRTFGAFPRVLKKYVREEKILTLTDAIRKMTHLPASRLGLWRRGQVRENFFADLVIFNAATIQDNATFQEPHQYPSGINFVIVNGTVVVEQNHHLKTTPGMILKKKHNPQKY